MRVLVAYYSETGNTEKVAKAIHEEVSRKHEAHLRKVDEIRPETIGDYDLVLLGSPCHSTDLAAPVKGLLKAMPRSPRFRLAGFFTHSVSSPERWPDARDYFNIWAGRCVASFEEASREKQVKFLGCYNCEGIPSQPVQEFIRNGILKSADIWEEYMEEASKHPDAEDLRKAQEFARNVLSKLY